MSILTDGSYRDTDGQEPYAFYERCRALGDVVWDPTLRAWLVVSFEAARKVCRDDALFVHPRLPLRDGKPVRGNNPRSLLFLHGAEHHAVHRWWVMDLFSRPWIERYKGLIDTVLHGLTAELSRRSAFDLTRDYIDRVPVGLFARLLDLPRKDEDFLTRLQSINERVTGLVNIVSSFRWEFSPANELIRQQAIEAANELNEILLPVVLERREGTGEDFVSRLWAGGPSVFSDWNEADTLDSCRRLFYAGIESVAHAAANAFYMLLSDTGLADRLRQGGAGTMERFVEEALRLNGGVQFRTRRASGATELGGVQINAGDLILVVLPAANRDARAFACPHAVDLARNNPRGHLSFFSGPRTCPAAALARAELVAMLEHAFTRFPSLRLDEQAPRPEFKGFMLRSYRPLRVRSELECRR